MVQHQGDALDKDTIFFIHNVFGNFFANTLDYFSDILYDRVGFKTVSTYDKAVEYCNKKDLLGREADKPMLPALILNPTGSMLPADANAGGKQLWRYPNLAAGLGSQMFDPIYQDENMRINPVFMRFKGEIELIYLVNSFYEYLDLKVHLLNHLGGLDRVIYPNFFNSYLIIPEDFVSYSYSNEYTGVRYNLDWSSSGATTELIRSTARNELVLPLRIKPNFAMTDLADGSSRYGGTDSIADWRLTANLNYEVEIPTYLVINSNYLVENIRLEVRYGSTYSSEAMCDPPINRSVTVYHWDWGLDETSNSVLDLQDYTVTDGTTEISITPPPTEIVEQRDLILSNTYVHIVTAGEADSTANWTITIPPPAYINGPQYAILYSAYCAMNYGDHWLLSEDGKIITIKYENENFQEGDLIEIHVYVDVYSSSSTSSTSSSSTSSSSSSTSSSSSSSSSSLSSSSSSSSSSTSSSSSSTSSSSSSTSSSSFSCIGWDLRQNVSNWIVTQGTWLPGSSEYRSTAGGSILLNELGTWINNYRPSKIRITHNYVGGLNVILKDKNVDTIAQDLTLNSGEELDITWGDYDLEHIFLDKFNQDYEVQNIEFYVC